MAVLLTAPASTGTSGYTLMIADDDGLVAAAQKLRHDVFATELGARLPGAVRGYLRLGSWVCGEPAYDPDFAVADFYVLMSMDRIDPRYRRHFLGATR
jgi:putative hemolysin